MPQSLVATWLKAAAGIFREREQVSKETHLQTKLVEEVIDEILGMQLTSPSSSWNVMLWKMVLEHGVERLFRPR